MKFVHVPNLFYESRYNSDFFLYKDGAYFVDSNPEVFSVILDYLRQVLGTIKISKALFNLVLYLNQKVYLPIHFNKSEIKIIILLCPDTKLW